MSQGNSNSARVSSTLKILSISLALILLGVSCYHGGSFLWRTSGDGYQRWAMVVMVIGLLAASHCLSHLVGNGIGRGKIIIPILCILTVAPIELFSVATSGAALDSRVIESVRRENQSSPEYKRAVQNIDNLQKQLNSQIGAMEKLPANQGTNIRKANEAIAATQSRIERAQTQANTINVSSTSAVYSSLESATGISSGGVSRIAAIILSVTPLTLGIAIAGLGGSVRRESVKATQSKGESVKKHKRHLQAV